MSRGKGRVRLHLQAENKALMQCVDAQRRQLAASVDIKVMRVMMLLNTAVWIAMLLLEKSFLSLF